MSNATFQRRQSAFRALAWLMVTAALLVSWTLIAPPSSVRAAPPPHTVFAIGTACPGDPSDHDQLWFRGSHVSVVGSIHSNAGIRISASTSDGGAATYNEACGSNVSGSTTLTSGPTPVAPEVPPSYAAPVVGTCTFNFVGDADLDDSTGAWWAGVGLLAPGTYCASGDLVLSETHYSGVVSLFAEGTLEVRGSFVVLTPFRSDGVLVHSNSTSDDAVKVTLANSTWTGIAYAPNGRLASDSSGDTVGGCVLANTVIVNGTHTSLGGCAGLVDPVPSTPPSVAPSASTSTPPSDPPSIAPSQPASAAPSLVASSAPSAPASSAPIVTASAAPTTVASPTAGVLQSGAPTQSAPVAPSAIASTASLAPVAASLNAIQPALTADGANAIETAPPTDTEVPGGLVGAEPRIMIVALFAFLASVLFASPTRSPRHRP